MRKIEGKFWDGNDGFCALGYYLFLLGAEEKLLRENVPQDVNYYREVKGLGPIDFEILKEIIIANDDEKSDELNVLLKENKLPFRLKDSEWKLIYAGQNYENREEEFELVH